MHISLRLLAVAAAILFLSNSDARAQGIFRPFFLHDGYEVALDKAQDTLASDARLVFAGTFGNLDLSPYGVPLTLNFYQDFEGPNGQSVTPGQADAWGYSFYSPSLGRSVNLVVLNSFFLGGFSAQGVDIDLPLPDGLTAQLDLGIQGTSSEWLMTTLKGNGTYTSYHTQYPLEQPDIVSLGEAVPDEFPTPSGFEVQGPVWTLSWQAGGDTADLYCIVAATTGQTVCQVDATTAAPQERTDAAIAMRALTSTTGSEVRIVVDGLRRAGGEISMELLDARGARVLDLTPRLVDGELSTASIAAGELASGVYFCRLSVDGASRVMPVSILGR